MSFNTEITAGPLDAQQPKEASFLFVCVSSLLLLAINVRIFGTGWAVFMVALCVWILYQGRKGLFYLLQRRPILVLLPLLFATSCLWSDERFISLSLGTQTLLSALTAVTIAYRASQRQLLLILFLSIGMGCLGSLAYGQKGASAEGLVLIGFLGSKDAMGLFAYAGVMASVAVLWDRGQKKFVRWAAFFMALVELYIASTVHAMTSVFCVIAGLMGFLAILYILARSKITRWIIYCLMAFAIVITASFNTEITDFLTSTLFPSLGKDATLTGRTVLWDKAINLFLDAPVLGHGFRAYWVGSSTDAHTMLYRMGVSDGRGFHFHEQYLETLADTGIIGFMILLTTFAVFVKRIADRVTAQPTPFTAYSLTVVVIYIARWFFETAFLPFSFDMMLFYMLGASAVIHALPARSDPPKNYIYTPDVSRAV